MFTIKPATTENIPAITSGGGINWAQVGIGIVVLLIGTLVYILDRAPDQTYFITQTGFNLSLYNSLPGFFGAFSNNLPSFAHTFAFILLTAGIITTRTNAYIFICLLWFGIDVLFEAGQAFIPSSMTFPDWFAGIPFLENTASYFRNGTFDWNDVAATAIAAIIAYLVLRATTKIQRGAP